MAEPVVAVVLAAGVGSRLGDELPKQFADLHGTPVIARTVVGLQQCDRVAGVHHPQHLARTRSVVEGLRPPDVLRLVPGGATRRAPISAALADLPDETRLVLQNAASPNSPWALVEQCLDALNSHEVCRCRCRR